jgi:NitT/TauT family transport system ATP-binding protein
MMTSPGADLAGSGAALRPLLRVEGVGKTFAFRGRETRAIDEISFEVPEHGFVSLIGPSGCGKSTLLQLVAGLQTATSGRIWFQDRLVNGPPAGMIYVFQQYEKSILPWRTVRQNIMFGLERQKQLTGAERLRRSEEYIELVGLQGFADHYPAQLSGGMQQRVAIARALICEPRVLLMDEPFSAVDALTRALLQELILSLWQRTGVTILFVTHDVEEAVYLSDRVIALRRAPSRIDDDVAIDLPYPRDQIATREDARFSKHRRYLLGKVLAHEREGGLA